MSACNNNPCPNNSKPRLPCDWIDIVMTPYNNPTGKWRDFNVIAKNVRRWTELRYANSESGLVCRDEAPPFPDPDDFSDLVSPGDLDF